MCGKKLTFFHIIFGKNPGISALDKIGANDVLMTDTEFHINTTDTLVSGLICLFLEKWVFWKTHEARNLAHFLMLNLNYSYESDNLKSYSHIVELKADLRIVHLSLE